MNIETNYAWDVFHLQKYEDKIKKQVSQKHILIIIFIFAVNPCILYYLIEDFIIGAVFIYATE